MTSILTRLSLVLASRLREEERGATAIEYALIVGILGVVVATAATALGADLTASFENIGNELTGGGD